MKTLIYGGHVIDPANRVDGKLNLQGGLVTGGEATLLGGGIYIDTYGSLTVGGTARVEDNLGSNVYVPSGKVITANGAGNAHVGVTNIDPIFAQADSVICEIDIDKEIVKRVFRLAKKHGKKQ